MCEPPAGSVGPSPLQVKRQANRGKTEEKRERKRYGEESKGGSKWRSNEEAERDECNYEETREIESAVNAQGQTAEQRIWMRQYDCQLTAELETLKQRQRMATLETKHITS